MGKSTIISQITGTLNGVIAIILGCPLAGIALTSMNGELHSLRDIPKIIEHGIPSSIGLACGWIFFKSPLVAAKSASREVSTDLAGTVTTKESSVEINVPVKPEVTPPPAKS